MAEIQSRPKGTAKLRGNPRESEGVRISKTLSWVLRHGSKSVGLFMRPDGYVRVTELVRFPPRVFLPMSSYHSLSTLMPKVSPCTTPVCDLGAAARNRSV